MTYDFYINENEKITLSRFGDSTDVIISKRVIPGGPWCVLAGFVLPAGTTKGLGIFLLNASDNKPVLASKHRWPD